MRPTLGLRIQQRVTTMLDSAGVVVEAALVVLMARAEQVGRNTTEVKRAASVEAERALRDKLTAVAWELEEARDEAKALRALIMDAESDLSIAGIESNSLWDSIDLVVEERMGGKGVERSGLHAAQDPHRLAAAAAFGIEPSEVTRKQREVGRILNLGTAYAAKPEDLMRVMQAVEADADDASARVGFETAEKQRQLALVIELRARRDAALAAGDWGTAGPLNQELAAIDHHEWVPPPHTTWDLLVSSSNGKIYQSRDGAGGGVGAGMGLASRMNLYWITGDIAVDGRYPGDLLAPGGKVICANFEGKRIDGVCMEARPWFHAVRPPGGAGAAVARIVPCTESCCAIAAHNVVNLSEGALYMQGQEDGSAEVCWIDCEESDFGEDWDPRMERVIFAWRPEYAIVHAPPRPPCGPSFTTTAASLIEISNALAPWLRWDEHTRSDSWPTPHEDLVAMGAVRSSAMNFARWPDGSLIFSNGRLYKPVSEGSNEHERFLGRPRSIEEAQKLLAPWLKPAKGGES